MNQSVKPGAPGPDTLQAWLDREREVRLLLAPPGHCGLDELAEHSGLELLQRIQRGELPAVPMANTLDYVMVECERGRVVFQGTPRLEYYNPSGAVHGGYFSTLLDSAMGCAVHSCLEKGMGYATIELKLTLLRALTNRTGPVRAEGKLISLSRRLGTAEGRLIDAEGRLYAHATTTCMIFPLQEREQAARSTSAP
jgi:uncharacterized protein (TIGR00369 family)